MITLRLTQLWKDRGLHYNDDFEVKFFNKRVSIDKW
jgi:hypothetical protein